MISPQNTDPAIVIRGLLLAFISCLLTGCISVFPKSDPAQLYRFGATAPQVQETASEEPVFNVFLGHTGFERAAAGDRILTVTGTQAAYVKGARWVTSAEELFDSALHHAFDSDLGPARLVGSGDIARAGYVLKLNVRTFEAQYIGGEASAPTIVVEVRATLARTEDQAVVADQSFKASIAASDNRVGAIVQAFDQAVAQVLGDLLVWVSSRGLERV
jgi:cholesterol transport system auxiliary component